MKYPALKALGAICFGTIAGGAAAELAAQLLLSPSAMQNFFVATAGVTAFAATIFGLADPRTKTLRNYVSAGIHGALYAGVVTLAWLVVTIAMLAAAGAVSLQPELALDALLYAALYAVIGAVSALAGRAMHDLLSFLLKDSSTSPKK